MRGITQAAWAYGLGSLVVLIFFVRLSGLRVAQRTTRQWASR